MKVIMIEGFSSDLQNAINGEVRNYSGEEIKEIKVVPAHEAGCYLAMIVFN